MATLNAFDSPLRGSQVSLLRHIIHCIDLPDRQGHFTTARKKVKYFRLGR